jgi:hypothetical protein
MKDLAEVRNFLDNDIYMINAGGCAIAALVMYRWLVCNNQLRGDEFIAYGYKDSSKNYFNINNKALEDKALEPSSCSHAFLYHNGRYFDSDNKVLHNPYRYEHCIRDFDFILRSINQPVWNDWFNRYQINKIQKVLKIDLSDIVKDF